LDSKSKNEIISFKGSFHGRTLGALAAGGPEKIELFNTEINGFKFVDFCDYKKIEESVNDNTAAILIEPLQGEAGIKEAPLEFLTYLRSFSNEKNILLIFDEVQCGMGRTGKMFAHQWSNVEPDIMTIAKALGNGFPLGACLTSKKVGKVMDFGSHGSTFGGNPLACTVGNSVLDIMLEKDFFDNVNLISKELSEGLEEIKKLFPKVIESIRGRGLMLGIRCYVDSAKFVEKARLNKLLTVKASDNVVRLLPPLILESKECKEALGKIRATCEMY
jgi:acetylornithine/N-succinyldiaminopimelate aminotransferase